jgi:hypothetical protein
MSYESISPGPDEDQRLKEKLQTRKPWQENNTSLNPEQLKRARAQEAQLLKRLTEPKGDISNYYLPSELKPQIDYQHIAEVLKPVTTPGRSIYEIKSDKRSCPLCGNYENWNLQHLKSHIESHQVFSEALQWEHKADMAYRRLLNRRSLLKQRLQGLFMEEQTLSREIQRYEKSEDCGPLATKLRTQWIAQLLRGEDIQDEFFNGDFDFGIEPQSDLEKEFVERKRAEDPEGNKHKSLQELIMQENNAIRSRRLEAASYSTSSGHSRNDSRTYTYEHKEDLETAAVPSKEGKEKVS